MYDPELYRSKDEVESWKRRDPIPALVARMKAERLLGPGDLDRLEAEVAAELAGAVKFAEASPWEPYHEMRRDVYTPRPA